MIKALLPAFVFLGLFMASCKKNEDFATTTGTNEKIILGTNTPNPTPAMEPLIYFIDKDTLRVLSGLTINIPTISIKGKINGTPIFGAEHRSVFNDVNFANGQSPVLNFTGDMILTTHSYSEDNGMILNRCFTPTQVASKKGLPMGINIPLKVTSSDQNLWYFSQFLNPQNVLITQIIRRNLINNMSSIVRSFAPGDILPNQNSCDVHFNSGNIYIPKSDGLYVTKLNSASVGSKLFSAPAGETMQFGEVKIDRLHGQLFFTTTSLAENKHTIWKSDLTGNPGFLKPIAEVNFTNNERVNLTFDISSTAGKIVYATHSLNTNTQQHTSTLTMVNMDGTSKKDLWQGEYINTVVAKDMSN